MDAQLKQKLAEQLTRGLGGWEVAAQNATQRKGVRDESLDMRGITLLHAAITRVGGSQSVYAKEAERIVADRSLEIPQRGYSLHGVGKALQHDLHLDYLSNIEELIHGTVFSDFWEMADHLLEEHYKDAAAVIGGSTLESHLRQLATKNGIALSAPDPHGKMKPKKADTLNSELTTAGVYRKLDQKGITHWLDLRNNAAHGHYHAYDEARVRNFLDGIRHFLSSYPA